MAVTPLFPKIRAQLQEQGIQPREVRLMRNKSSGENWSIAPIFVVLYSPFLTVCHGHSLSALSCSLLFIVI